jgi:hypothetical protein
MRRRPGLARGAVLLAVLTLAACSSADDDAGTPAPAPEESQSPRSPSAPASPTDPAAAEPAEPPAPAPPPTTSGSLTPADLPDPAALGEDWQSFADPGGVEEGFQGNGSWARAREPQDLVAGLAPIGCTGFEPPALPVPAEALEGTYEGTDGQGRGVSIVLGYPDEAAAQAFMTAHEATVTGCSAQSGAVQPEDPLTLVIEPVEVSPDRIIDIRREFGAGAGTLAWTEVVLRVGARVGLLSLGIEGDGALPDTARMESALRAALRSR